MREAAVDAVAELAQPEDPVAVSKVGQGVQGSGFGRFRAWGFGVWGVGGLGGFGPRV